MYDNYGIGSPQMAVTPDFSMDEAMTMLDEYKGGHNTYPVAYDVVDRFVEKYESSPTPSDSAVMSGRNVDTSIASFDISLYNEIKISSQEMRELQSEALTWDADKRNVPLRRTLSSGIEYLYSIDSDGIVHIYERKQSNNIHEWSNEYDNRDSAQLDSSFERFRDGQRYDNGHYDVSRDGREQGEVGTSDRSPLRRNGSSHRGGDSQASSYDRRKKKAKGYKFDDDGRVIQITYSDGTVENIMPSDSSVYQPRETREYTDRELLAGALDSVATSEEDRKKLTQYKAKVAEADELDRTLTELRAKKKALEEAKAKRSEIRLIKKSNIAI